MDDVPAVAVTLNTNDFGDIKTLAILAQIAKAKAEMSASATNDNANLVVVSGTNLTETSTFLHGACLADFAVTCGNLPGVTLWAPVQEECSLGTLDSNIDQTLFMDEVYVNSLEFSYTTGANATENYGAETDNKMWLLNAGRFVNWESFDASGNPSTFTLTLASGNAIADLSNGKGFLRKDFNGAPAVSVYDSSATTMTNWPVVTGAATATAFGYAVGATHELTKPVGMTFAAGDRVDVAYSANAYGTATADTYFNVLADSSRPSSIGAIRQGQVEVHIVSSSDVSYDLAWRLTGCTISADLTREPLTELGHLGPYDRPLTLPIPITVTVDTTAGDLENWAKVAAKLTEYDGGTLDEISLTDLMAEEDLMLVVKVYAQTDEEAGGTGASRTIAAGSPLVGETQFVDGVLQSAYAEGGQEYPLKTMVVEHLKITDEGMTLDMGSNATQTFGFRSTNDLYVVKGDVTIGNITGAFKIRRNG